jgi:hypothetical protein
MSTGTAHVWRAGEGEVSLVPLSAVREGDFVLGRVFDQLSWLVVVRKITMAQEAPVMMHSVFGARFLPGVAIVWDGKVVAVESVCPCEFVHAPLICHLVVDKAHAFVMVDNVLVSPLKGR